MTRPTVSTIDRGLIKLIADSISDIAEEDGWVFLGVLGNLILKKQPDFDPRNFGYTKLIDLIKNIPEFEIDRRATGKNNVFHIYVRPKENFSNNRFKTQRPRR
jgi:Fe-S-cluster formation regulator IscX/YfhJ